MKKIKLGLMVLIASFFLLVSQVQALTITFGGDNTGDFTGLHSVHEGESMFITETFDLLDENGVLTGGYNIIDPTELIVVNGGFSFIQGDHDDIAASPAGDDSFYGYTTAPTSTITVPLVAFGISTHGTYISYLGLYYGSIDTYNDITFLNSDGVVISSGEEGSILFDGILEGSEILAYYNAPLDEGDWLSPNSNVYVNLDFGDEDIFSAFQLSTTNIAFEIDNITVGLNSNAVPEPSAILLFGLGLLGLASIGKRKQ